MKNKIKNFRKELEKAKNKLSTAEERVAFLNGVSFYCDWEIKRMGN